MQLAKTKVVFVSFSTVKKPRDVDVFIKAAGKDLVAVRKELLSHYPAFDPATAASGRDKGSQSELLPAANHHDIGSLTLSCRSCYCH